MKAFVFPGQGSQFVGMGEDLYQSKREAKDLMLLANEVLGFDILSIMFSGSEEDLKQTKVTQPAIFIHSMATLKAFEPVRVDMVAGHSLGEFSALVANGTLSFEDGLKLIYQRAQAMQQACDLAPSSMAAVLGLEDEKVEEICAQVEGVVVPANYNCPGQIVISGDTLAVEKACELLKQAGAKRALMLPVNGAFHSPLMAGAQALLSKAIEQTKFNKPVVPIYQNVMAKAVADPIQIKENLVQQLTGSVLWTQTIRQMIADGVEQFVEIGPGNTLQGLIKKIDKTILVSSTKS